MCPIINKCHLLLLFCFFECAGTAQFTQPAFLNYSTDHGLPSSECYDIIQDKEGYIWISTDNGVSRFNGYAFENFGPEQGLKNNVVFYLQEDHFGRIWMGTLSSNIYMYETDTVKAFPYNHILQQNKGSFRVTDFYIDSIGTFYAVFGSGGSIRIQKNGSYELKGASLTCRDRIYFAGDNRVLYSPPEKTCFVERIEGKVNEEITFYYEGLHIDLDYKSTFFSKNLPTIAPFRIQGGILLNKYKSLLFFQEETLIWSTNLPGIINCWRKNIIGEVMIGLQHEGAYKYPTLTSLKNNNPSASYLDGHSISHILEDQLGGLWLVSIEAGIFYSQSPGLNVYNENCGLVNENIAAIALKDKDEIYVGLNNGEVYLLHTELKNNIKLPKRHSEKELLDLFYDSKNQVLWKGTGPFQYFLNGNWELITRKLPNGKIGNTTSKKIFPSQNFDKIWVTVASSFYNIDLLKKKVDFYCGSGCPAVERTFTIHEDFYNRIWLGRINGLYQFYEQDTTLRPERSHPAFSLRVEDIQQMADSTLVVGTKGGGIVLWKDSSYLQISEKDGLTASMIENIHIDSAQHIWVGTLNGLNKITCYSQDSFFIKTYTTANGLPSNEINDVDSWGADVWVATTRGLAKLPDTDEINRFSPVPRLEKVLVNGAAVDPKVIQSLPYNQNNLEINLLTINYKLNGKINYRYRLSKNGAWTITQNRRINFPKLPPDDYFFEVQSQNEDGVWSNSAIWTFGITPPFWKSWWFLTLLSFGISSLAYLFYRNRIKLLEKENKNQKELNNLERAALRAQMNPHFLSNCLNTIQGFIYKEEKMKAMRYLSEFNDLLRETLELSRQKLVPLEEDINLIRAYLNLEKMRFDQKFDYQIETDKNIDIYTTEIPPLLIQPFVENAIVHAFPKEVNDPNIHIGYSQRNGELLVTVTDNGIGLTASRARKTLGGLNKRRSFGMEIPQKRLGMMGKTAKTVQVEELKDEKGKVLGTKVSVFIRLENTRT